MSSDCSTAALSSAARVVVSLLEAHQAVDAALEKEMRQRLGLSCGHFDVLRTLVGAPDQQLRMADIAERNCISRSGVTQSVDRLEELGLVSRVTNGGDRRLVIATITPAGRALVPIGQEVIESVADRFITERLTARQAATLASALAKVADGTDDSD